MTPFRIVFMGTPEFAVPSLAALISGPDQVVGVVCQPDRPKGRGRRLLPPPVKVLAEQAGLPVLQPVKIRSDALLAEIAALRPDLLVVAAYGRILPGPLLNLPALGAINVHGSLLPKYRGAAPIQWALINGEPETGVTIMQMDEGMDTGAILLPAALPIDEDDTSGCLFVKLAELGAATLLTALERLHAGSLPPIRQDDTTASEAPMLRKEMGHLDWGRPAPELHCLIRGLDPWPMASSPLDGRRLRLFAPKLAEGRGNEAPGTILRADALGLLVATGQGRLLIREVQPEGRRRMTVAEFLHGARIEPGACFISELPVCS